MFERFTERARQVLVLAQDEARSLKHQHIGTEHILSGLLREGEGLAARTLSKLKVYPDRTREEIERLCGVGYSDSPSQIPYTPRAKKALELALREALSLGHNYIGTEHILLGLVREPEGVAVRILQDFDASPEKVREEVIALLLKGGAARNVSTTAAILVDKQMALEGVSSIERRNPTEVLKLLADRGRVPMSEVSGSVTIQTVTFFGPTKSFEHLNRTLAETCGAKGQAQNVYYTLEHAKDHNGEKVIWPQVRVGRYRIGSFGDVER